MLRSRFINFICLGALILALLVVAGLYSAGSAGLIFPARNDDYLDLLFDDDRVHTIDIQIDNWDSFIAVAPTETYSQCSVVIDGEHVEGVGLRAKGNNSLSHVSERGLERYSLKIEFDHYREGLTYHGLDKLSLDASFQDNSYLKTYLALDMMRFMEVPTPATSFVYVTVNGEPWGLFLAIEEPEDAFVARTWGQNHGVLYKPDYFSLDDKNLDIGLNYLGDNLDSYPGIFSHARTEVSSGDKERLVEALRLLSTGDKEAIEQAVDVDEVLRYFAVQTFVANLDSYLGRTGHNYLLYEEQGTLSMLPWDYNLAFGTYALGREELPDDATSYVNLPIDTPMDADTLTKRQLFTQLMAHEEYRERYYAYLDMLATSYVDNGLLRERVASMREMIAPYVTADATAFCNYEEFLVAVDTLEQFCLLRAKSIQGQLDGTIPSTSEDQAADPSTLIDASHINLADLGELSDLDPKTAT